MPKSNPVSAMPLANCPFNEAKPNVASLLTAQPPAVGSEAKLKLLAVSVIGPSVRVTLEGLVRFKLMAPCPALRPAVKSVVACGDVRSTLSQGACTLSPL